MNQPHRGIRNASFCAAIGLAIGLLSSCATGTDSTTAPQSTADAPRTSSVEFNALRVAVVAAVSPADLLSVAVEDGRLAVQLMPDQEPIARSLAARYGDQLQITLGALPYPPGKTGAGRPLCRSRTAPAAAEAAPVSLRLELSANVARPGATAVGTLFIRNTGARAVQVRLPKPYSGSISRPGENAIIGGYLSAGNGSRATERESEAISIGAETSMAVSIDTASCDEEIGYLLPPGRYDVTVEVEVAVTGSALRSVSSPPVSLTLA